MLQATGKVDIYNYEYWHSNHETDTEGFMIIDCGDRCSTLQPLMYYKGDKGIILYHLLPIIIYLKAYLDQYKDNVDKCKPLFDSLVVGIDKHFGSYFKIREMLVSSAYFPQYKLAFLN
uniref:Uncharacterized protein n=1 Tax=Lepeophtheirus salmonis TaxID=72036 RepID=A0A0K2TCC1_LEPSM